MKGKVKRILSGMLSVITIMTSIIQPITIYAAETEPAAYEAEYPALEKVKDNLAEEEVVQVQDYEVEVGSSFDAKTDFSGMKFNLEKVKVTFHEAKNESGQDFDVNQADSYKAVYFVEPFSKNPSYHVTRKIIVKEPITEAQTERSSDSGDNIGQTGESESEEDSEAHSEIQSETEVTESETVQEEKGTETLSEVELDAALEAAEEQDTVDEESGLSLGNVMLQAVEQGVDLLEMEEGETVTFAAQVPALFSARAAQNVTVTRGSWYYYADYGLGTYLTAPYTVTFGNVTATAYCVQPSKPGPDDGNYTITKLADGKTLAKVCYYGTKASGDEGFFAEKHPDFSTGKRFIITHLAASYANGSSDAFSGTNSTGQSLAMELYNYCVNQPEIPDVAMSFSNANVTAYVEGNEQRTEVITFQADTLQTITMKLPAGVKFHNVTTGKTSKAGADVEVSGGTKFYLSAPLTQTADVSGSWSATMKGSITKDYSASMDIIRKTAGDFIEDMTEQLRSLKKELSQEKTHLEKDDLILKISGSMGSEYSYHVVTNLTAEQLLEALEEYHRIPEHDKTDIETFLPEKDAVLISWYDSIGYEAEYPVDFYDLEYDYDTGVTVASQLSAIKQAEMLIKREEYGETMLFNEEERKLIMNHAFKLNNMEDTKILISEMHEAIEAPDLRAVNDVMRVAQEEINALPDSMVGISEMYEFGYTSNLMLPLTKDRALELFRDGCEVFHLYSDDTEAVVDDEADFDTVDDFYGIEKETWDRYRLQEKNKGLENLQDAEKYQGVDFFDVPALFSNGRVNISSLPEGVYRYELQGTDYDPGYPLYVKESVVSIMQEQF